MRRETFSIAWRAALVGLVLLALGLPAYTQVGGAVGGVPSRLRVQSLGVGTAAPAGNGDAAFNDDVTVTGDVTAATFAGSGASLTALNASQLSSGTVPDARFPATLPAASGANLTGLNASNVSSGTLADGRLSSNVPLLNTANTFGDVQTVTNDVDSRSTAPAFNLRTPGGTLLGRFYSSAGEQYLESSNSGAPLHIGTTGGGAIELNGINVTDFARLSQGQTFLGDQVFENPIQVNANQLNYYPGGGNVELVNRDGDGWTFFTNAGGNVAARIDDALIELDSTAIDSNGVDMTPSSGTFTLSYTNGCSTTPTQSARWYKIGSAVTITVAAALSCTGDTTTFDTDAGDVPAAIRPSTSNVYGPLVGANNNGTSVTAMVEIATNGEVIVNRCGAVTGTCDGGAWTGSGARGLDAWTVSYVQ